MARPEGETEGKLKWTPGRIAYLVLILLLVLHQAENDNQRTGKQQNGAADNFKDFHS